MKRHPALQPISKEHRIILSFCLDLKKGIQNDKPIQKIEAYIRWFWKAFLSTHFLFEEKYLFTLNALNEAITTQALKEHKAIRAIINQSKISLDEAARFVQVLEAHIRFEERQVFEYLQNNIAVEMLKKLEINHSANDFCIIPRAFWD